MLSDQLETNAIGLEHPSMSSTGLPTLGQGQSGDSEHLVPDACDDADRAGCQNMNPASITPRG